MKQFIVGFIVGTVLASSGAYAAGCFGTGYLSGWTVEKDGDEVCDGVYVRVNTRTIECD